jgi:hypothetical protein
MPSPIIARSASTWSGGASAARARRRVRIAEPALVDGSWVLKLIYDGDTPKDVPRLWHGHHVLVEKAPPPPPPPAPKSG